MAPHQQIAVADVKIYFCDPHAPWQRPGNENTNGLLRQYFPKGSDLPHDTSRLQHVADEQNGRPRKVLAWKTPAEAMTEFLDSRASWEHERTIRRRLTPPRCTMGWLPRTVPGPPLRPQGCLRHRNAAAAEQFLAEALLLSALGGLAGTLIGAAATASYALSQHWQVLIPRSPCTAA
jgi:hypothetical protein